MNKSRNWNNSKNSTKNAAKTSSSTKGRGTSKSACKFKRSKFDEEKIDKTQKTNNPDWYMTNPQIVEGLANIPFNLPTGTLFDLVDVPDDAHPFSAGYTQKWAAPGVLTFDIVPTFGTQTDKSSVLNIAAQAIYTWVRYYNSGARNYTPSDLMTYLIANAQIYSMINWAMRVYGTIKQYDHRNQYMSRALIRAMGVDYDDILGNMAQYRGRLNILINKAASFVVPTNMTYFSRTASMFTDIYVDGDSIKDQFYIYNPVGFYRFHFDEGESPRHQSAYLQFHTMTSDNHAMTMNDIMSYIDDSISAIFEAADQGVISGDLYKAYQGNILTLANMSEDYVTNIVHDEWVLNQMRNASIVGDWMYPDVYQDENLVLHYDPHYSYTFTDPTDIVSKYCTQGPRVLSVPDNNPDTRHVMEYTRLMASIRNLNHHRETNVFEWDPVVGTEIVLRLRFWTFYYNQDGIRALHALPFYYYAANYSNSAAKRQGMVLKTYFKYFPAIMPITVEANSSAITGLDFDIDNYALIDQETLENIHNAAIMNLFATEAVAKLK